MEDVREKRASEVEVSISRSAFRGSRFGWSLVFLLVFLGSSAFADPFAPQMILPSMPNLPSGEKTYDASGAAPDRPKEEMDAVSRPADVQGEVKLKPDTEAVKANKYKIDYTQKTKRIGNRIYDKNNENKREGSENNEQIPEQPTTNPPSVEHRLGFDYQAPQLGRIGFDSVDKRKGSKQNEEMVPQF